MSVPIDRALISAMIGPGAAVSGAVALTLGAVAGARVLDGAGAVPGVGAWLAITALGMVASLTFALPLGAVAGATVGVSRLVDEGAWTGFQACGVRGRRLAAVPLGVGLAVGALTWAQAGYVEPALRRQAAMLWADGIAVSFVPGVPVGVGGAVLIPQSVGEDGARDVFIATPTAVGEARTAALRARAGASGAGAPEPGRGTLAVELGEGAFVGTTGRPWRVDFRRWTRDLPAIAAPRVELDQRTTPELWAAIGRTEAAGRDARYERAVARKRWTQPLAAALLPLAALPLGVRARPWLATGLVLAGWLVATRAGDALARLVGEGASGVGVAYAVAIGAVAWASWRDR